MKTILLNSTAIKEAGFDDETNRMDIKFNHDGDTSKTYRFCGVPWHIFNGLIQASSKGKYYDAYIRENYPCTIIK